MKDEILPLFRDVLLVCEEMNLLGGTFFALDGCKLKCNASPEGSRTVSELRAKREKLGKRVKELLTEQEEEDRRDDDDTPPPDDRSYRSRQIEKLKKQADRIEAWLKENGERLGVSGRAIKSNMTDNESCKMFTSSGTVQGYNGQALVDSKRQVIVHAEAFGTGHDYNLVPPMLSGAMENLEKIGMTRDYFKGTMFAADSGYHSKVNIQRCMDEEIDAYIPDRRFRKRDPRFKGRKGRSIRTRYGLNDFRYHEESNQYECPNGRMLSQQMKSHRCTGTIYRTYGAQEQDCQVCMVRSKCLHGKGRGPRTLNVPLGPDGDNLTTIMIEKIESEKGRRIYPLRMAIVEPVFANIRTHKRLDRFTLRGRIKVNIQWLLYCMVHNIGKIANYGFA